jgi:hypothetical protein
VGEVLEQEDQVRGEDADAVDEHAAYPEANVFAVRLQSCLLC